MGITIALRDKVRSQKRRREVVGILQCFLDAASVSACRPRGAIFVLGTSGKRDVAGASN